MAICIVCGKENDTCLCDSCRHSINIEDLCLQIIDYKPGSGENVIWDKISSELYGTYNFKNIVFAISDELPSPRKEYMRILCLAGDREYVAKYSREWLYETYEKIKNSRELTHDEKNRVRGLVMSALVMDYRYQDADEIAAKLTQYDMLPRWCYYTMGDYYTKTRRYDEAEDILMEGLKLYQDIPYAKQKLNEMLEDNAKRRTAAESGKKEYMPAPKDAKQKYIEFMATLGVDVALPRSNSRPKAIPKDQYPAPIETRDADFNSFVAWDIETTGLSTKIDSIIEFGAIKVIDGQLIEEKEFIFQELVKPYDRKVSAKITELTGISQDDVKDVRPMWEVTPDFLNFVGDLPLVGYNSVRFDSQFLGRAGRYSNIIIENKHFDVMIYAEGFAEQLGIDPKHLKLGVVSDALQIENPRAHRALADAITTAKVFLKLKEMGGETKEEVSVDDLLADLDEW